MHFILDATWWFGLIYLNLETLKIEHYLSIAMQINTMVANLFVVDSVNIAKTFI